MSHDTQGQPPCILLVEDNPLTRTITTRLLETRGYRVVAVKNGATAVSATERESFDLILMDVQMPEMDGLQATGTIRAREETSGFRVPILALTAHAFPADRDRCLAAGMDVHIAKPVPAAELFVAIEEALARPKNGGAATRRDSILS